MNLLFLSLLEISSIYGQTIVGGQTDDNDCLISAGYKWCKSSNSCIRQWETPCNDNFNDCDDCLQKQRDGLNIACPPSCNMITSMPIPEPLCSDIMCGMYCGNGFQKDKKGCDICLCDINYENDNNEECLIPYQECNDYVCPKVTEITQCSNGGIQGYTTYQISVIINDNTLKNIYAVFGSTSFSDYTMHIPPAYQIDGIFGENIGGVENAIISIHPDSLFDSWLTIGITDGDTEDKLNSIGIDFSYWNLMNPIDITDGAIYTIDPREILVEGNEYILGQFTILTNTQEEVILNVQGSYKYNEDSWNQHNIHFQLNSVQHVNSLTTIPKDCIRWYDGCNICNVNNGVLGSCSRIMCFQEGTPTCTEYNSIGH